MTPRTGPHARAVQAVVFDLDDTLYLERDYVRSGFAAVAEELRRRHAAPPDCDAWMWQEFLQGRRQGIFNALAERLGLPLSEEDIRGLVEAYRTHRPVIRAAPEAVQALAALKGRAKRGLLSDGFLPAQRLKLDAIGLADEFDAVVFTEEMGRQCWKPSPAGFERIAGELGVAHADCAYVADNPAKDFVAPNALGWRSVQWRRAGQVHADNPAPSGGAPQVIVGTVDELLAALGLQGD